jgi:hypothetical protein
MTVAQSCRSDNHAHERKLNGNDVEEGPAAEPGSGRQLLIWGDRIDSIAEEEAEQ